MTDSSRQRLLQQTKMAHVAQDGTSHRVTCQCKRLVEEGCMQENRLRYDQTRYPYSTPPMTEPLYSNFNGPNAERNSQVLLRGLYKAKTQDPYLVSFLDHCQRPEGLEEQPLEVDLEDHVSFWRFVPAQWCHLLNFAIEKKPGEIWVDLMRTIQMMNSELQANNKRVGKLAMAYAEQHNLIPKGQHGSCKRHQAIDLALTKCLTWDVLHLQCRLAGWISKDANLSTRVRTGCGDSDRVFIPPTMIPFQGCGQGNETGPPIWVAISSIRLGMMIRKGFGFDFLISISWAPLLADCLCFVDDTDVCQAAPSPDYASTAVGTGQIGKDFGYPDAPLLKQESTTCGDAGESKRVGPDTIPSAQGGTSKCRNFPCAMVSAPIALQGVGVPHPYDLQVIKHVDMLLRHPANKTKTGGFLEAVLQAHQLETGTSYGLFQQVYTNTSILASDKWAKRTWSELNSFFPSTWSLIPPLFSHYAMQTNC
ncbi:unnamed protein product [Cylindrotheca closterium]|uniref:Uncharacterized protein n=1 Tax=Cylindrotheca closterium TaxID=2856 RepID=A0AAD2CVW3_9STRA|nr:unnamed protein product [Cylindrotheca closterium]